MEYLKELLLNRFSYLKGRINLYRFESGQMLEISFPDFFNKTVDKQFYKIMDFLAKFPAFVAEYEPAEDPDTEPEYYIIVRAKH